MPGLFTLACLALLFMQVATTSITPPAAPQAWSLKTLLYLSAMLTFVAGINLSKGALHRFLNIYLFIAGIWALLGLTVWLGLTEGKALVLGVVSMAGPPALKISGPFDQGNIFAALLGFAWLFAHWLFMTEKKPRYLLAIIFFTAMLFDTFSRGAWIGFAFSMMLLIYASKKGVSFWFKTIIPCWLAGIVIGYTLFEINQSMQLQTTDMFFVVDRTATSLHERFLIWTISVYEFLSAPWFGVGWGQFQHHYWFAAPAGIEFASEHFGTEKQLYNTAFNAHNIFLQLMAEGGVVTLIIAMTGLCFLFAYAARLLRSAESDRLPYALAVLGFFLHAQVGIIYHAPLVLLLVALFSGIVAAPFIHSRCWKIAPAPASKMAYSIPILLVVAWAAYSTQQWFKAETIYRQMNIHSMQSIERLTEIMHMPRVSAIPFTTLGYTVAMTKEHSELLTTIIPNLETSLPEIPSYSAYQVLFYAHRYAGNYERACQVGRKIMCMHFYGELNTPTYNMICQGQMPTRYHFGQGEAPVSASQ